jgi:L-ascorbate peroxidase
VRAAVNVSELRAAKQEISELIQSKYCNPILIRLGWHDAGTFDKVRFYSETKVLVGILAL